MSYELSLESVIKEASKSRISIKDRVEFEYTGDYGVLADYFDDPEDEYEEYEDELDCP